MNAKQLAMFNLIRHEMEENQAFDSKDAAVIGEVVRILTKYGITVTFTQNGFK